MELNLKNKVAVITGGGKGIGKSTAIQFASEGIQLILNDVEEETGEKTIDEIRKLYPSVAIKLVVGDISKQETAERIISETINAYGGLDILVNNAGISPKLPFTEITPELFDQVININLKSTFLCSKAAFEPLKKSENGRIINLSSFAGRYGAVNSGLHYSASKAGIIGITMTLAKQMGPHNITVNCVAPGRIDTDMTRMLSKEKLDQVLERIPMHRLGTVEEVSNVITFLASDAASYITGSCIDITGGYMG